MNVRLKMFSEPDNSTGCRYNWLSEEMWKMFFIIRVRMILLEIFNSLLLMSLSLALASKLPIGKLFSLSLALASKLPICILLE